jgi:hypothetical protein
LEQRKLELHRNHSLVLERSSCCGGDDDGTSHRIDDDVHNMMELGLRNRSLVQRLLRSHSLVQRLLHNHSLVLEHSSYCGGDDGQTSRPTCGDVRRSKMVLVLRIHSLVQQRLRNHSSEQLRLRNHSYCDDGTDLLQRNSS